MRDYSSNETVDILLVLGECQHNYRRAEVLYAERFPTRQHPNASVIRNIEIKSRNRNVCRKRRSHHELEFDNNNPRMITVLAMIYDNPHISLREIERTVGIPKSTASRYLRGAKYHPYHVSVNQALSDVDCRKRLFFCQWALQRIRDDADFFKYVLFSDEATFHSTGILNRHNSHYWSAVNPHWMQEIDNQHRWSVTVWCGIVN